jgi:hypothetical protein
MAIAWSLKRYTRNILVGLAAASATKNTRRAYVTPTRSSALTSQLVQGYIFIAIETDSKRKEFIAIGPCHIYPTER